MGSETWLLNLKTRQIHYESQADLVPPWEGSRLCVPAEAPWVMTAFYRDGRAQRRGAAPPAGQDCQWCWGVNGGTHRHISGTLRQPCMCLLPLHMVVHIHTWMSDLWACGALSHTAWQIELNSLIKWSLRDAKPTVVAPWVLNGWVTAKRLGNHKVMWVRDVPGEGCTQRGHGAAPNPSEQGLGAGKTTSRSMPHWVLPCEQEVAE